jgi:dTDP-4-dehydrorhamnose 3,5-epimerase
MQVERLEIADVALITPTVFEDGRGFFMETWNERVFREHVADRGFVQDNHSRSVKGTLRGLHYQIAQPQGKLVRVTAGEVFDVAVDLRRSSASFGNWVGVILSAENRRQLWVPEGFAHGFLVLSESAEFLYKCTDYYAPEYERSIIWNDPEIAIDWPLPESVPPILSGKDQQGLLLGEAELYP